jgi:transcription elongation factor GreB
MSRGFVKEDDQEEIPIVPQRAFLPEGVTNFVTPSGMEQLLEEKEALIRERDSISGSSDNEKRIAQNYLNARLQLLNDRISSAQIVHPEQQPQNEIRFGATVTLKAEASQKIQTFRIVGVDEADISKGKISFLSPISRLLINKKTGEKIVLKRDREDISYQIMEINYK